MTGEKWRAARARFWAWLTNKPLRTALFGVFALYGSTLGIHAAIDAKVGGAFAESAAWVLSMSGLAMVILAWWHNDGDMRVQAVGALGGMVTMLLLVLVSKGPDGPFLPTATGIMAGLIVAVAASARDVWEDETLPRD